ncbi:efflux RND transporter periplasmic adaptor subunit [Helicobacter sp. MIT 05-5293]|uniref:Secretion protein HlyD n=1 Tax=uncultured Helicobacter sp. TaxID=175537 RepID=A0A650EKU4_9HELI|nr:efflux RND transporter periplasmic adaptor subunit [Helicobacter sp. MIT 05-5293]QGT50397.1 secretion protein HlyD [uncultured Helicobacter sp.]TLD82180.1 efflux RND transporter periplasmic adaptor subunit [Helicobacter sp. MIT 05-5293]
MNLYQTLNPKKTRLKLPKWLLIALVVVIIFIIALFVYFSYFHQPSLKFDSTKVQRGNVKSTISASGSLSPMNKVEIGSVISGLVLEVLVEENDHVTQGQVLARINPETINQQIARYEAQLASAQAQLKASEQTLVDKKWNYDQLRKLYEATNGDSPSLLELQNAKTAYTTARSDVEIKRASILEIQTNIQSSKIDLKNSQIVSSIDGVVLTRSVEVGQSVAASFQAPTLFEIAENLEEMQLKANISEADIGKVKEGQDVTFTVDAYPDKTFRAKVDRVNFGSGDSSSSSSSSSSTDIVSYIAKMDVDNKSLLLRPDMSATADIVIAQAKDALLVPNAALYFDLNKTLQRNNQKKSSSSVASMFTASAPRPPRARFNTKEKEIKKGTLWILKDGVAQAVDVEVGITDGTMTQILNGIDENTEVITGVQING